MIVDPDFVDHWKTRLLCDNLADPLAPMYMIRIWSHCHMRKAERFEKMTSRALKAICRYDGDADRLEAALIESGYIERDGSTIIVCGFLEKNASLVQKWESGKKGGRPKEPDGNRTETGREPGANRTLTGGEPDTNRPVPVREPIREEKSREEKIREEKKEQSSASAEDSAEASGDASAAPIPNGELFENSPPTANDPVVFVIPCRGEPSSFGVKRSRIDQYAALFPGLDIVRELNLARQYLIDAPTKKPGSTGAAKFLTGWLKRSANWQANRRDGPAKNGQQTSDPFNDPEFIAKFNRGDYDQ